MDILYIEDNPDDADIFSRLMKKLNQSVQYTIIKSGTEAIDYLSGNDPALLPPVSLPKLLLLDLNLVGMSGFEVLQWARSLERTRCLPIVAFSTSDNPRDIEQAYAAGINAYLVKPGTYKDTGTLLERLCQFWLNDNTRIDHA